MKRISKDEFNSSIDEFIRREAIVCSFSKINNIHVYECVSCNHFFNKLKLIIGEKISYAYKFID